MAKINEYARLLGNLGGRPPNRLKITEQAPKIRVFRPFSEYWQERANLEKKEEN